MTAATAHVVQQSCEPVRELAKHQLELLDIHVAEINRLGRRMISDAIEIGRRLHACKGMVGHGNWGRWLKEEFDWSEQAALNFIRVYEMAKTKSKNFVDLNVPLSALYLLAAPSTPAEAVDEVFERAERGEVIELAEVRETVKQHKDNANGKARAPDFEALQGHVERLDQPAPKKPRASAAPVKEDPQPEPEADEDYAVSIYTDRCLTMVRGAIDDAILDMRETDVPKAGIARLFPTLRALIDDLDCKFKTGGAS